MILRQFASVVPNAAKIAAICAILCTQNSALADTVPGTAYSGPAYYFSTNMDPIEVTLRLIIRSDHSSDWFARLVIPRAYIFFASGYSQKRPLRSNKSAKANKILPKNIEAEQIKIMLMYPDGIPYSIALKEYAKSKSVSIRSAAKALRTKRYVVTIRATKNAQNLPQFGPGKFDISDGQEFGLRRFKWLRVTDRYFGTERDVFRRIDCLQSRQPNFFCHYYLPLGSNFFAKVEFIDFRSNGGRAFANERIRVAREVMCRFVRCS